MMLTKFLNKKIFNQKQNMLQSVIGIGDILVFEIDRNNDKRVIETLKKLFALVENLFAVKTINPDKFLNLILSQDYVDLYKKNTVEARFNISIDPEGYMDGFSTIVNQIMRVYKKAVEGSNLDIARFAIYNLNKILHLLTSDVENDLFVELILRKSSDIIYETIDHDNSLLFNRIISSYKEIVFNYDNKFKIRYLNLFDHYFFSFIKVLIVENKFELFKGLIANLIDGLYPDLGDREIWDYGHLLLDKDFEFYNKIENQHGIEDKIKGLDASLKYISSAENLEGWKSNFESLKKIIDPNLQEPEIGKAKVLERIIIKNAENQFKINKLRKLFISIGAFCLLKNRIQFIKYFWHYRQPEDADAIWLGSDVMPENLDDLMTIYFDLLEERVDFFMDHQGSQSYIKNYSLLLLCKLLQNVRIDSQKNYNAINLYHLPDLDINKIKNLTYRCDDLVSASKKLMKNEKLLTKLGFENIDELFNEKVIPFIEHIKLEAESQISAKHRNFIISQQKIEKFKEDFVKDFYELATLRALITNYFKSYKNFSDKQFENGKAKFGLSLIDDKAVFFETWHISFSNWQRGFAQSLATSETRSLFKEIMDKCEILTATTIQDILGSCESLGEVVILTSGVNIWKFFEKSEEFKASWRNDVEKLNINCFKGWYDYKNNLIPVFGINNTGYDHTILVLDKNKFGTLYQYSPINIDEDKAAIKDIFYINIKLLTEREDLLAKAINEQPEWLKKVGEVESEAQKAFIQERIIIDIYERFKFVPAAEFIGYKWEIL